MRVDGLEFPKLSGGREGRTVNPLIAPTHITEWVSSLQINRSRSHSFNIHTTVC